MKPVNFALMIVSVMALTSAVTIASDRYLRSRMHKHTVDAKPISAQEKSDEILVHQTSVLDFADVDKGRASATDPAIQAFGKAAFIKPVFQRVEDFDREELTFPEVCIGMISNQSFSRPPVDNTPLWAAPAINSVRFHASKVLQLRLGEEYLQGLKHPSILKKIDPALFQELTVEPSPVALIGDPSFDLDKQDQQVIKILDIVSSWTELEGFFLSDMSVSKETIKALSNLKKLQYLKLWHCETDVDALAKEPFLQRLKYLSLTKIPCQQIIDSICDSSKLESLSLSETKVSAYSLDKLRMAPRLTVLNLRVEALGPRQLEAITKLKKVETLSIRDSNLNPDQLKYLLAKCPSLKRLQLNGGAAKYVKAKLVEDPRIQLLN